jgi:hypothetical protein
MLVGFDAGSAEIDSEVTSLDGQSRPTRIRFASLPP